MQAPDKKYKTIYKLIKKDVFESLTESEKAELEAWLSESQNNRDLYERIRNGEAEKDYQEGILSIDLEKGWSNVFRIISRKRSRSRLQTFYKVAAVLVVLLASTIFGINYNRKYQQSQYEAYVEQIEPAAPKATLIRDNTQITIQENQKDTMLQNDQNLLFLSNNQISYYSPVTQASSEVSHNTLVVPRGGYFKVVLADSTAVWVNSESELKFPEVFNRQERRVFLKGEAYFDVTPGKRPFIVVFDNKELEVLGTSFNIRSRKGSPRDYVTLAEGLVNLNTSYKSVQLQPGQQAVIHAENREITLREVDHTLYTDWIRGKFIYRNAPLAQIIGDLERWYDVDIAFENEEIKELRFSLFMNRKEKISEILDILKETNRINFKFSKNQILLTEN